MFEKINIKSMLVEADIYREQGLLKESRTRYIQILELIKSINKSSKKIKLIIGAVNKKITVIENELSEIDYAAENPEFSEDCLNLVKEIISLSRNKENPNTSRNFYPRYHCISNFPLKGIE